MLRINELIKEFQKMRKRMKVNERKNNIDEVQIKRKIEKINLTKTWFFHKTSRKETKKRAEDINKQYQK